MLRDLLMKIGGREYMQFAEVHFDFSEGESRCKLRIVKFDLSGRPVNDIGPTEFINDLTFFLYGSYLIVWLALMVDQKMKWPLGRQILVSQIVKYCLMLKDGSDKLP